jgi:hypothetical protein
MELHGQFLYGLCPVLLLSFRNDMLLIITVLAFNFVYYLDGEKSLLYFYKRRHQHTSP